MRWSKNPIFTLKQAPSDVDVISYQLLVRGGYIRRLSQGLFTLGPLLLRSQRKFENIIRQELDKVNCAEIFMPMVQPKDLWDETGRWDKFGHLLLKLKNRTEAEFCLGPTHEEVIVDYVRRDLKSYRELPMQLFQIQTKYRDEIRPRFGLMRAKEFLMKDAYSFDVDKKAALESYENYKEAYQRIFKRTGLNFCIVQADSGDIGGDCSNEFHILTGRGEDELLVSDSGFAANKEICPAISKDLGQPKQEAKDLEEFSTPKVRTIEDLSKFANVPAENLVKTLFLKYNSNGCQHFVCALVRGCDELNPIKLKNALGISDIPEMINPQEVITITSGASPGSCGPVGLSIPVIADESVKFLQNYIVGANKDDYHFKNVNHDKDYKVKTWADIRFAKEGDIDPSDPAKTLKTFRGIEVGHIFYLGQNYSKAMKLEFTDKQGELKNCEMGCYGIGVTRTLQAAIEQSHDDDGIVWPAALAPHEVHICLLDPDNQQAAALADEIYDGLKQAGYSALLDDRSGTRPGVKFKDADLLGMPFRVTIGQKGLDKGIVETACRKTKEKFEVDPKKILSWLVDNIESEILV